MITFSTLSFIFYTIFVIVCSFLMFNSLYYIIDDIKRYKKSKKEVVKSPLKIGGIYGKPHISIDKNNPFSPIREYDYYVAIIDVKPSRNGDCDYCQYVYLSNNMSPYSSYSNNVIFSNPTKILDDWEYIKDIDLNTIKFS